MGDKLHKRLATLAEACGGWRRLGAIGALSSIGLGAHTALAMAIWWQKTVAKILPQDFAWSVIGPAIGESLGGAIEEDPEESEFPRVTATHTPPVSASPTVGATAPTSSPPPSPTVLPSATPSPEPEPGPG